MRRRLFCLMSLAALAACAETPPPAPTEPESPETERVYSPGPIAWDQLSEEHRRRARQMLARHQESVPDDEDALRARWNAMSPAQQRFAIRQPRRLAPPRDAHVRRGTTTTRTGSSSTARSGGTSQRGGSSSAGRSGTSSSSSRSGGTSSSSSRSGSSSSSSRSGRPSSLPTPPRPPQPR